MPPRRVYPSWLPPNPRERGELLKMRRLQVTALGWMIGFLPAGWVLILVTRSTDFVVPLTVFWLAVGLFIAQRVTAIRCPRCGERFCEKAELPYWYGLFNRRCESCGLSLVRDQMSNE